MQEIFISRLHFPVTTLGPGSRVGIWLQGCSIRCEGCISVDTWRSGVGRTHVSDVVKRCLEWGGHADGVTITGGEPFDQPSALVDLVQRLSCEFSGDILVYSGYSKAKIQHTLDLAAGCIDALISEPFDHKESDTLPIRGSDNQELHFLTDRGRQLFTRFETPSDGSALDAMFDEDGTVWFCGIPKRNDLKRLERILQSKGHRVVFTAQDMSKST